MGLLLQHVRSGGKGGQPSAVSQAWMPTTAAVGGTSLLPERSWVSSPQGRDPSSLAQCSHIYLSTKGAPMLDFTILWGLLGAIRD